jgi:PAS domain S-box-containing protein
MVGIVGGKIERLTDMHAYVVGVAPDCVIVIDAKGKVVEFNPAAEAMFGYSREEAVGQELAELVVPERLRERHRRGVARCAEAGAGTAIGELLEFPALRADGSELPVEVVVTSLPGPEPMFAGFVRDVAERQRAEAASARLAALIESTDDAVLSKDGQGIITSWNPGAERIYGYRAEEAIGRSIGMLVPDHRAGEEQRILDEIMQGHRIDHYETERMRKDRRIINVSVTISPLRDRSGQVVGASVIARDMTARTRGERAQRLLAQAGAVLDRSLNPRATLQAIAELTVPELCELCVIDLADEDGRPSGAVVAGTDPNLPALLERTREEYPLDPDGDHPVARALRTGEPEVLPELTDDVLQTIAESDDHLELMRRFRYRSAIVAPLRARGRTLGVLSVLHLRDADAYDEEDLQLLVQLASRAAVAFDNARLYSDRSRIAATLQQSLLPPSLPEIPGFDLAAHFRPAGEGLEVGGDFYDVRPIGDRQWVLVMGDVCGKGAPAAALTALARYTVRALAREGYGAAETLTRLNSSLIEAVEQGDRYLTAIVALLELRESARILRVASAGHPSPLLVGPRGCAELPLHTGPLAGVYPDAEYEEQQFVLKEGETVVFYTDGVTDAAAPASVLSIEDLTRALASEVGRSAAEVAATIDRLATQAVVRNPRDDIAILALRADAERVPAPPAPRPDAAGARA